MDFSLRCNSLKCRSQLNDRAVVTTCSHVFCLACAESLGLANPAGTARVCPACEAVLANPDDAVVTQLSPTEDYKTSVLSGLSPTVIMECAGRGLAFYSYQATQEILYQEYLARSLTDKYSNLSTQMDKIINDANAEITSLRDKLSGTRLRRMHLEQRDLEKKNHELVLQCREKSKQAAQFQKLYNHLKHAQMAAGIEIAADQDAEAVLQAAAGGQYKVVNGRNVVSLHNHAGSGGSRGGGERAQAAYERQHVQGSNMRRQSPRTIPAPETPSHRTRLPIPLYPAASRVQEQVRENRSYRPALTAVDPNIYSNRTNAGYGLSAGVKAARQQSGLLSPAGGIGRHGGIGGLNVR